MTNVAQPADARSGLSRFVPRLSARDLGLIAFRTVFLALILWLWHGLSVYFGGDIVSEPMDVLLRLVDLIRSGEALQMTRVTLTEVAGGLLVGGGLGIVFPFILNLSPRATRAIEPFIKAMMGIPKLVLSPIIILWFGIGLLSKVVLIALMVFFLVFVSTFSGIRSVDIKLMLMCRIFGARPTRLARELLWNSALPFIVAAVKIAIPWAINAAIVAEFLAADAGLGYYIRHSYDSADTTGAFAGLVIVTVVMVVIDFAFSALCDLMLRWRPTDDKARH